MAFLRELARVTATNGWSCIGFCLMTTHYHLLLEVGDGALPTGMQSLNFRFAINFNQRHRMRGHVQFERYGSKRIVDDEHLSTTYRYTMRNPLEAGLCESASTWRWSSFAGTIGLAPPQPFIDDTRVLGCFGAPRELAAARLRAFVEES
jgi:putative transposase